MNCPLCEGENIVELEILDKNALIGLYYKLTATDYAYLIKQNLKYCECRKCKLRFYDPLISGDEKFYNSLQKFDWYYLDDKYEYTKAKEYINAKDKVLEVGSGKGAFAKHLKTKDYIGLDFSSNAKDMAAKNGIIIENKSIKDYADNNPDTFDVVASFQVLEHVTNPKSFIEAKINALKPGGKMIIAVPSEESFIKYSVNSVLNMPPHHLTRWSDATLEYVADFFNLDLVSLHHGRVEEIHKEFLLSTYIQSIILKNKLIDLSFKRKVFSRVSNFIAKIIKNKTKDEFLPYAHTVIAVYRKR